MSNVRIPETTIVYGLAVLLFAGSCAAAESQYKKFGRDAMSAIDAGKADVALKRLQKVLSEQPGDPEVFYCLAVAHAQKNDIASSLAYAKRAVDAGLPVERFGAGPRRLLAPLTESTGFRELAKTSAQELIHGPTLGTVTDSGARFWVRTAQEVAVKVLVYDSSGQDAPIITAEAHTRRGRDYTAVLTVGGLKPSTRYDYQLMVDGKAVPGRWPFRTFPPAGGAARFQVGFGGGAGYTPKHERMWNTIASHKLRAFLFLGDNVYIDRPKQPAVQRYCYYRRQSRPEFRGFAAATPLYAIWDDHDFTTNDARGGPEIDVPAWKRPVWRLYQENWNNPYYGGGENHPGCWFHFAIGDVDFIMLDGRYYRSDPRGPAPSMLGPVQKQWLFDRLRAATGTFKVLASPVPWSVGTKPGSLDTWDGYPQEREEIFSFIEKHRIDGVLLIAADRHRSEFWKTRREKGYPLYEFESSRLTNVHTHRLMPGALAGYNKTCSFGLLSFDTTKADPEVKLKIVSIDNEVVHTLTLKRSQLSHPKER